jgi:ATP-dependent DNA helicase RecG
MPVTELTGVGPVLAQRLAKRHIFTVQDLLFHLPLHYQDRTQITPIRKLQVGKHAVVEGVIQHSEIKRSKRVSLLCRIADGSGVLTLRYFYFNKQQQANLSVGTQLRCYGEVRFGAQQLEMIHPEVRRLLPNQSLPKEDQLTPIYPSTEGINQHRWRNLTDQALALLQTDQQLEELLPEAIREQLAMPTLSAALHYVHRPPVGASITQLEQGTHACQQRLAFEELLAHHLLLRQLRQQQQAQAATPLTLNTQLNAQFLSALGFTLTAAQQRVINEIQQDLAQNVPMLRLVQGDVGCGKTVVAAMAMLQAVSSGMQAALMAPTEILSEQHYANFQQWFAPLGIQVAWLAGKLTGKARQQTLIAIANGEAQVVIGTHALFQAGVEFQQLGLVVIDEQHRFGVEQRLRLRDKSKQAQHLPHQLVMTATPIPRTLAMLFYADLDCSVIDELPPGRQAVQTAVLANTRREEVIARVAHACTQHTQVYWVCPLIEESDSLQCQAAEVTAGELQQALPKLRIGLVHGRMPSQDKVAVMSAFKAGEIDLLVATTVIEVGVDVPAASLMIIENAERLGLSQLHQLRGRVGRGAQTSHCVLLYQPPLSEIAKKRLAIMRETNDGFRIAQEDLALRGAGEMLGTRQTGSVRFRLADLQRDKALFTHIQQAADYILQHTPEVGLQLSQRWLGAGEQYASVA